MRNVFADTHFWIAVINPHDQWHEQAMEISALLGAAQLITTDGVLVEVLNYFAEYGAHMRRNAAQAIHAIFQNVCVETLFIERAEFFSGLTLYEERLDKGYSLTDCISMNVMREHGISEVLTHDKHFAQEGFTILL